MSTITGYRQDTQGVFIPKDPEAQLIYQMDWSQWLPTGDTISTVSYTVTHRANDADPVTVESSGITTANTYTFCELAGGTVGKIYTITAAITTADGLEDRRNFRVKVEARSA